MISIHVSAVCRVRDGYTGQIMRPSAITCALDGIPCRPVGKEGGYLVFTNVSHGSHCLSLRCNGYQEEWVEFEADGGTREIDVTMKPGAGYPFRQPVTRLTLTVLKGKKTAAGRAVWLAAAGQEMRIAQTKVEAGEQELRLYCKGTPVPGTYLIEDGKKSEIIVLRALEGEKGILAAPLQKDHSRSKQFLPAQRYHIGDDGIVNAVFRGPCTAQAYTEKEGLVGSVELSEGENQFTVRF